MNRLFLSTLLGCFLSFVASQGEYDFGGRSYPNRHLYSTYATIVSGELIEYGFYTPLFANSLLPTSSQTSNPNAFALVEYFYNLNTFDKYHPLLPFEFIHLHYNPLGHSGSPQENSWSISHFDIHLSLKKPEYIRGIDCQSGHGTACETNPLFYHFPEPIYFPNGTWNAVDPVEQMGIHWYQLGVDYGLEAFSTKPANLFVSFNEEIIIHEPMVSIELINNITNSPVPSRSFFYPRPQRHQVPGLYFDTFEIRVDIANNRLVFACKDLYRAHEWFRDLPMYIGALYTPPTTVNVPIVSTSKNCHIQSEVNGGVDSGYEVTDGTPAYYGTNSYCCLKKLPYRYNSGTMQSECVNECYLTVFTGNVFIDPTFSRRCFTQCYERVPV